VSDTGPLGLLLIQYNGNQICSNLKGRLLLLTGLDQQDQVIRYKKKKKKKKTAVALQKRRYIFQVKRSKVKLTFTVNKKLGYAK